MANLIKRIATDDGEAQIDYNALANLPTIPSSLSSFGVTATATELNYATGVTSNIQAQINAINTALASYIDDIDTLIGGDA